MKWSIAILLAVVAFPTTLAGAAPTGSAGATKKCEQVPFTPNSDDVATNIRATGLTCGLARDFVLDSQGRPGKRFRGFRCTAAKVETEQLPCTRYRCTGAGDVIRWRRY